MQPKRFKSLLQNANRCGVNQMIIFSLHEMEDPNNPKAIIKSLADGNQQIVIDSEINQTIENMMKK